MKAITSFEDLDVWKVGRQIRSELYALTAGFPKQEQYCLGQQVRTAAISLTANIAEGYGRFHFTDKTVKVCVCIALQVVSLKGKPLIIDDSLRTIW
ncbi:MAG: four helix bundle protein [Nitrospira sp.]|nr:four helix bundle protein [Nitrospira sp.]